jgi:HNH endonuclease
MAERKTHEQRMREAYDNFENNIVRNKEGCWGWNGYKNPQGYGILSFKGKGIGIHRYMWERIHGPIKPGMFVCHKCDNPVCANPDHLSLGTPKDNAYDRFHKDRTWVSKIKTDIPKSVEQHALRGQLAQFLIENPMSWIDFSRRCGISPSTLRKFTLAKDLKRAEPLFKIIKFIREYKSQS